MVAQYPTPKAKLSEVKRRSVTANNSVSSTNGVLGVTFLTGYNQQSLIPVLPELPAYWSYSRDNILSSTPLYESSWANAISIAKSKFASLSWDVEGDISLRVKNGQELLLLGEDGQGWVDFIYKVVDDYLLCDNGAFIEIIRATQGAGSKIIGLMHLDSLRCIRTGNPQIPVIYYDRLGQYHELQDYQVITISDSPNARERWYSIGFSAASRAYHVIRRIAAIERALFEKITGGKPVTLDFVTGITQKQLDSVLASQEAERQSKGAIVYGGSVITAFMSNENINHVRIPFAGLPDNFDIQLERNEARLQYANAIGLDPQDLQPLSGSSLGSGQQSQTLSDKARGKGLASLQKILTHVFNQRVLPDRTTFAFNERDLRDEKSVADIKQVRATFTETLVKNAIITAEQAKQILADTNDIPQEFIEKDLTSTMSLADYQNNEELETESPVANPMQETVDELIQEVGAIGTKSVASKAKGNAPKLIKQNMAEAKKIYESILNA